MRPRAVAIGGVIKLNIINSEQAFFSEISALIEQSRRSIYANANSVTVLLFWRIGQRINNEILDNKRADYGKK